jgi:hypothetical protein
LPGDLALLDHGPLLPRQGALLLHDVTALTVHLALLLHDIALLLHHGALLLRYRAALLHGFVAILLPVLAPVLAGFLPVLLARLLLLVVPVLLGRRDRGPAGEQRGEGGGGKDSMADLAVHAELRLHCADGSFAWDPLHVKSA